MIEAERKRMMDMQFQDRDIIRVLMASTDKEAIEKWVKDSFMEFIRRGCRATLGIGPGRASRRGRPHLPENAMSQMKWKRRWIK